jgi:hypothetical protein
MSPIVPWIYQCVDILLTTLRIINNGSVSAHVPRPLSAHLGVDQDHRVGLPALQYRLLSAGHR